MPTKQSKEIIKASWFPDCHAKKKKKNYNYDTYIRLKNILPLCKHVSDCAETIYKLSHVYTHCY